MASISNAAGGSLIDCLRGLREQRWSGAVRVHEPKGSGVIYLVDGRVVHAEYGRVIGEFAYWQLVGLPEAQIQMKLDEGVRSGSQSILRTLALSLPRAWDGTAATRAASAGPPPAPEPPALIPRRGGHAEPAPAAGREAVRAKSVAAAEIRGGRVAVAPPRKPGAGGLAAERMDGRPGPAARAEGAAEKPAAPAPIEADPKGAERPLRIERWMRQFRETVEAHGVQDAPSRKSKLASRLALAALSLAAGLGLGVYGQPVLQIGTRWLAKLKEVPVASPRIRGPQRAPASSARSTAIGALPGSQESEAPGALAPVDRAAAESALEASDLQAGDELPVLTGGPAARSPEPQGGIAPEVVVRVLVNGEGKVTDAAIYQPRPELRAFEQVALAVVAQYRFKPARRQGQPVSVWVNWPVPFRSSR